MRRTVVILIWISALAALCPAYAGPNMRELQMFRTLVADYSKTSGGSSPALSPDRRILAFTSSGDIWIRQIASDEEAFEKYKEYEPWKLSFDQPLSSASFGPSHYGMEEPRNLDWSVDGRLVFAYRDGRLYLAENLNLEAKTANVRILADLKVLEGETGSGKVESPRWSPDGRKVAFIRTRMKQPSVVSVVDVGSGDETILTEDASCGSTAWMQPWSPDGKYLTYASYRSAKDPRYDDCIMEIYNICTVSVDGSVRRRITGDGHSRYPSWSPNADKIAFSSQEKYKTKYPSGDIASGDMTTIYITDSDGAYRRRAFPSALAPSKEELAAEEAVLAQRQRQDFGKQFGSRLTSDQAARLSQGKVNTDEMCDIAVLLTAKEIGGDFQRKMESAIKTAPPTPRKKVLIVLGEALKGLPENTGLSVINKVAGFLFSLVETSQLLNTPRRDDLPVWSPDGQKLAFVSYAEDDQTLFVTEIASGLERKIFSMEQINWVTWTADGRSLVIGNRRSTGWRLKENTSMNLVSYPEISLLEFRQ